MPEDLSNIAKPERAERAKIRKIQEVPFIGHDDLDQHVDESPVVADPVVRKEDLDKIVKKLEEDDSQ